MPHMGTWSLWVWKLIPAGPNNYPTPETFISCADKSTTRICPRTSLPKPARMWDGCTITIQCIHRSHKHICWRCCEFLSVLCLVTGIAKTVPKPYALKSGFHVLLHYPYTIPIQPHITPYDRILHLYNPISPYMIPTAHDP